MALDLGIGGAEDSTSHFATSEPLVRTFAWTKPKLTVTQALEKTFPGFSPLARPTRGSLMVPRAPC